MKPEWYKPTSRFCISKIWVHKTWPSVYALRHEECKQRSTHFSLSHLLHLGHRFTFVAAYKDLQERDTGCPTGQVCKYTLVAKTDISEEASRQTSCNCCPTQPSVCSCLSYIWCFWPENTHIDLRRRLSHYSTRYNATDSHEISHFTTKLDSSLDPSGERTWTNY